MRKLVIFNGKIYKTLLSKYLEGLQPIKISESKRLTNDGKPIPFNIYLFKIDGITCALFEKFLGSGHYYGLKGEHKSIVIPDLIRQRFGELWFMDVRHSSRRSLENDIFMAGE